MKVLMVGPHRKLKGGIATVINNYYNSSLVNKIDLIYIPTIIDGGIFIKLIYAIISYIRIFFVLLFNDINIVHIHMASRTSFYRKSVIVNMSKIFNKKIIIHMHGAEFDIFYNLESNEKGKKHITNILNKADIIIALSENWKMKISKYCDSNIEVIYNSTKLPDINLYNNKSKYITLLGRLDERKGIFDLLAIIKNIIYVNKDIIFILAGDGEIEKLRKLVKEYEIDTNVHILDWIDAKKKDMILRNTLIYTLPSYNEGMPMSILEAMSYGIPIVTSNVGGIPNIIEHCLNGFMIEPGDKESLKNHLLKLIKNPALRLDMSKNGYEKAKNEFDLEKNISKIISIYNEISK